MLAFLVGVEPGAGRGCTMAGNGREAVYRKRDLWLYVGARFLSEAAALALSVSIGWAVYGLSNAPLALGMVGLAQFIPTLLLTLPAGEMCDRLSPRRVLAAGLAFQALCAVAFFALVLSPARALWPYFVLVMALGGARAFIDPADQALLPFLVAADGLPRALAWGASSWQLAVIAGPALGGLAYAISPAAAYGLCGAAFLLAMLSVLALGGRKAAAPKGATVGKRLGRMTEGLAYVWLQPLVLGAISLDLFAVLLGGATVLMPIYARDILHMGPVGLGLLRSAPAVGAFAMTLALARRPLDRSVGPKLFVAVAIFGIATLIFAFSKSRALSIAALLVLGASDIVSVNIRSSLVQLATPDALRGRVSAVNMLFIGASGELGAFESGVVAALIGTVPAVALGGVGTLAVAAIWMWAFPALRRADCPATISP